MIALDAALLAASEAAAVVVERSAPLRVRHKGTIDLVTEVDLECERVIRRILEKATPNIPIYAEEGGGASTALTRWVVDPLDGTTNYVHGFPSYGVSIALQEDGQTTLGVIADPVRQRLFSAQKGKGAFCDGERLRVSDCRDLIEALVGTGFPYDRHTEADYYLRFVSAVMKRVQGVRRAGAACMDLAMLAAGQLDAFWEFHLAPWDVAAGVLLVEESGGRVTSHDGTPLDRVKPSPLATNQRLHEHMMDVLATVK